ncbi:Deoxycytidine monophosphate (dCMP) deaminase [Botryosphaeria dothidea]
MPGGSSLATCLCIHAEENALLEAGRERIREGSILYCDTCPCLTCSIKITQVGISEVVYSQAYSMDTDAAKIFEEGGVKLRQFVPPREGLVDLGQAEANLIDYAMASTDTAETVEPTPHPLADLNLTQSLTALLQQSLNAAQLKKGANEVTKALNRGAASLVVLAADTKPIALLAHMPELCEDKNVPYIWIPSKVALGRACGLGQPVIAAVVLDVEGSELMGPIGEMKETIERLMI